MRYQAVKLILIPTDEQKSDLDKYFGQFGELCEWLQSNCPEAAKKYKDVYTWAYHPLRRKGAFAQMIGKISGKVSQHRIKKMAMDCNYMLCDNQMFSFKEDYLRLKLMDKKIDVRYKITSGKNTKSQINKCISQSGVLCRDDRGYIFHLRVHTPRALVYSRK